jgi:predicted Zn-ribbon and HTH transcriptional regulator
MPKIMKNKKCKDCGTEFYDESSDEEVCYRCRKIYQDIDIERK